MRVMLQATEQLEVSALDPSPLKRARAYEVVHDANLAWPREATHGAEKAGGRPRVMRRDGRRDGSARRVDRRWRWRHGWRSWLGGHLDGSWFCAGSARGRWRRSACERWGRGGFPASACEGPAQGLQVQERFDREICMAWMSEAIQVGGRASAVHSDAERYTVWSEGYTLLASEPDPAPPVRLARHRPERCPTPAAGKTAPSEWGGAAKLAPTSTTVRHTSRACSGAFKLGCGQQVVPRSGRGPSAADDRRLTKLEAQRTGWTVALFEGWAEG